MERPSPYREHLEYMRVAGCTDDSIESRRRAIARTERALGKPVLEASPAELLAWALELSGRVTSDTVAAYTNHVRCYCAWAVRTGLIDGNPAILLPRVRLRPRLPRPIGEEDLTAALAAADDRVRPWLALAAGAGLRCREIAHLRREDVRDKAPQPVILVTRESGKGRKERIVPLAPWVKAELEPVLAARRAGFLFRAPDGRPYPPHRISQIGGKFLHSAGIPETMHQFRHRFGTALYEATHDLRLVQELMGHSSPVTTAGYVRWSQAATGPAVAAMPVPGRGPRAA